MRDINIKHQKPDFYLGCSREVKGRDWEKIRSCWAKNWLIDTIGQKFLWIRIDPPIIGERYGLRENISDVLISPHAKGTEIELPMTNYFFKIGSKYIPCFPVYVFRILNEVIFQESKFGIEDVEMIAWCNLFATEENAQEAIT